MTEILSIAGAFILILLSVLGVLLLRILNGIDDNTKAVSALSATMKEFQLMLSTQAEKTLTLKTETEVKFEALSRRMDTFGDRHNDLSSKVSEALYRLDTVTQKTTPNRLDELPKSS